LQGESKSVHWMKAALAQAQLAFAADEVPIGCVIVYNGQIIASAHNQTRALHDPTAHAEILAIRQASSVMQSERLSDCTLICTLEPCAMCVGAMIHARLDALIFAALEPKTGACGSAFDLLSDPAHNHRISSERGVLAEHSTTLLQRFFKEKRMLRS
jgi:tRNA(adenine34) deaminase